MLTILFKWFQNSLACEHKCRTEFKYKYWDIVHWKYPSGYAAKEGYGIIFDNRQEGKPYWRWRKPPIIGYTIFRSGSIEPVVCAWKEDLDKTWEFDWHVEKELLSSVLQQIERSIRHYNYVGILDNLSYVEILNKIKDYEKHQL